MEPCYLAGKTDHFQTPKNQMSRWQQKPHNEPQSWAPMIEPWMSTPPMIHPSAVKHGNGIQFFIVDWCWFYYENLHLWRIPDSYVWFSGFCDVQEKPQVRQGGQNKGRPKLQLIQASKKRGFKMILPEEWNLGTRGLDKTEVLGFFWQKYRPSGKRGHRTVTV